MKITRRLFLKNGGVAIASVGLMPVIGPGFVHRAVYAADSATSKRRKTVICIFQRGAVDGLSMIVPHGDPDLYRLRPVLGIPRPSGGADQTALDLDGFFGLHPALKPLLPFYQQGHLAAIHACGSPNGTRSHFDAQDYMESGAPGNKGVADGWLARALLACPEDRAKLKTPFRAVAVGSGMPRSLQGEAGALAIPDLRRFGVADLTITDRPDSNNQKAERRHQMTGGAAAPGIASGFETLYDQAVGDVLHGPGKESFDAIRMLRQANPGNYTPAQGASYPAGRLGESLKQIAQLIKADVGVEIAFAETGGWDTHVNQGTAQGQLANRLQEFGGAIAALYTDLGDRMRDVVILTMSEFGRTARQNGNNGTDHGHGTAFLVLGGDVNGGKVLGSWPGLAEEQLYERRDLAITTDFRSVFGEVALKHLGATSLARVFPGYQADPSTFRGVIKS